MSLIYSLLWIVIFMSGGIWLNNNNSEILSYVAFTMAGLSLLYPLKTFQLSRNRDKYTQPFIEEGLVKQVFEFKCQNCQKGEPYVDMNIRKDSQLYMSDVIYTRNDGAHVRGLLCFSCNNVSEYVGGTSPGQIEYLKNYKLDNKIKLKFLDSAERYGHKHMIDKINKINIGFRISTLKLLVVSIIGYFFILYLNQ